MMNTWLMRRAVRRPVSLRHDGTQHLVGVQAALHQQLGLAETNELHRLGRRGVAVRRVDDAGLPDVDPAFVSPPRAILAAGPTRIGMISPFAPASSAPASAVASQGCATAVGIGSRLRQRSSSCSYFPVPVSRVISCPPLLPGQRPNRGSRFSGWSPAVRRDGASRASPRPPGRLRTSPCTSRSSPWPSAPWPRRSCRSRRGGWPGSRCSRS